MKNYLLLSCLLGFLVWGNAQPVKLRYNLADGDSLFYQVKINSDKFHIAQELKFEVDSLDDGSFAIQAVIEKIEGLDEANSAGIHEAMSFGIDSLGELVQELRYIQSQEKPKLNIDEKHYFLSYPQGDIAVDDSWKTARAVDDLVFDSVFTSYTLKEVNEKYARIYVTSNFSESTQKFQKSLSGEYIAERKSGKVLQAMLENKSFTGFSHIKGQIIISKWDPYAPPITQEMKVKYLAEDFAATTFDNEHVINRKSVFIMDKANMPTYLRYKGLEEMGLLQMTLTDSVHCCKTFNIKLSEAGKAFVVDSLETEDMWSPIVQTYRYDSIQISKIIAAEGYFEIKYKVINLQPTPFVSLSRLGAVLKGKDYESQCFVREINGSWQLDKDNRFRGYQGE